MSATDLLQLRNDWNYNFHILHSLIQSKMTLKAPQNKNKILTS